MATTVKVIRKVMLMEIGQPPLPRLAVANMLLRVITELPSRKLSVGLLKTFLTLELVQVTD